MPEQITTAAEEASHDLGGYVFWSGAKPETSERLTALMGQMNLAVIQMKRSRSHGVYGSAYVTAARAAVGVLRDALAGLGAEGYPGNGENGPINPPATSPPSPAPPGMPAKR
jgi:hypothetical protein